MVVTIFFTVISFAGPVLLGPLDVDRGREEVGIE
jgi:hypothetical protein